MAEETTKAPEVKAAKSDDSRLIAAISYLWLLSIVFYVLKKDDAFVQFHAKQGIVIFGLSLLGMIPFLGFPIWLLSLVLVIVGALKAYQGVKYRIPFIADLADKITF